jgi:hypothetical protein
MLTPPNTDIQSILSLVAGQGLILNLAVLGFYFSNIDPLHSNQLSFSKDSLIFSTYISVVMIGKE